MHKMTFPSQNVRTASKSLPFIRVDTP